MASASALAAAQAASRVNELVTGDWHVQVTHSHILQTTCLCKEDASPCDYCRYLPLDALLLFFFLFF